MSMDFLNNEIFALIAGVISVAAFVFGSVLLFRKGKPLYFQLIIAAVGCSMLAELNRLAYVYCGNFDGRAVVGTIAVLGSVLFLLSANLDQLDGLVDGGTVGVKTKLAACIAPLVFAAGAAAIVYFCKGDLLAKIVTAVALLPALPASYLNLKHLLMNEDEIGFLRATKGTNIAALGYYASVYAAMLLSPSGIGVLSGAPCLLITAATAALALCAERGAKIWTTSMYEFS